MSKGQLSSYNSVYLNNQNTHIYTNHRPTSSKDALLERPLLSQSLMQKRRESIQKNISQLYKSPVQLMHGLDGALNQKQRRPSQSSSPISPQAANQSIMSTLVVGGHDQTRNNSSFKKGPNSPLNHTALDLGQMLNPVDSNSLENTYSNKDI